VTRTGALVPLDSTAIDRASDPVAAVEFACQRAKALLTHALEHGEIERIVELKSQAEAVRIYSNQKKLGKEAELAAAEIVRRATDALGRAVREGQQTGEIRKRGQWVERLGEDRTSCDDLPASPSGYFSSRREMAGAYATAGVPAERFEQAVAEAKAEGNLSQANVVRKVAPTSASATTAKRERQIRNLAKAGHTAAQIGAKLEMSEREVKNICRRINVITADAVIGRTRRIDPDRVVDVAVSSLEGLVVGLRLVEPARLDPARIEPWTDSLTKSLRVFNRFCRQLKEMSSAENSSAEHVN
jgi:DNA-binding CsgD family transcriptional regulator